MSNCGDSCSGRRRSQIKRSFEAEISCTHHWKETYLPFPSICTMPPKVTFLYLLFSSHPHQQNFFVLVSPIHLHFKETFLFLFSFHYSERCFPKRDQEIGCVQAIMAGVAGTWHTSDGNRDSAEFRAELLRITIIFTFWSKCSCTALFLKLGLGVKGGGHSARIGADLLCHPSFVAKV